MGSLISAECGCGYASQPQFDDAARLIRGYLENALMLGNGRRAKAPYYYPSLCRRCREVVPADLELSPRRCPLCRATAPTPYFFRRLASGPGASEIPGSSVLIEDETGRKIELALYKDVRYLCPRCGEFRLTFKHEGGWD